MFEICVVYLLEISWGSRCRLLGFVVALWNVLTITIGLGSKRWHNTLWTIQRLTVHPRRVQAERPDQVLCMAQCMV